MKTNHIRTSLLCSSIMLFSLFMFTNCKKKSNKDTVVTWKMINPVTGEPYVGIPVSVFRSKTKFQIVAINKKVDNVIIWEGVTDANGEASCRFKAIINDKYDYLATTPTFSSPKYFYKQPAIGSLKKNQVNELVYEGVGYGIYLSKRKNINCFDSNDKMRFRVKTLDNSNWSLWNWGGGTYLYGCVNTEYTLTEQTPYNIYIYEVEATKNNITTTYIDTFYHDGIGLDTFKIYY
jgi:hypothetical protein